MSEIIPDDLRFAPAQRMKLAPQCFSSHLRQPLNAPVLFGLMNFSMQDGFVLHCVESHMMLSVQHSIHVGPSPPFLEKLLNCRWSLNVMLDNARHSFKWTKLGSPPRNLGLANLAAQRVISVVMVCLVLYKTRTSSGLEHAEHFPQWTTLQPF